MARFDLQPHPDHPPASVESVSVDVCRVGANGVWLEYAVKGREHLLLPARARSERADGLWRTTCFECFFMPEGGAAYREFNFSPSFQWAAYEFDSYRTGGRDLAGALDLDIEVTPDATPWFWLAAELGDAEFTGGDGAIALSAVIEEVGGTKSYWALHHAPGPPDFHNPACFTATLPPPPAA